MYLRSQAERSMPPRPCGRIYNEFGLQGKYMEVFDATFAFEFGIDFLGHTVFGDNQLMSMVPYEGNFISKCYFVSHRG